MPPEAPDAVLFDNDGLLLDTESVWSRAEEDLFERTATSSPPSTSASWSAPRRTSPRGKLERWLGEDGRKLELMAELDALVVAELEHGVEAMVGARDLLERLKAQGTPIGLVSNSPLPSSCARWRSSASKRSSTPSSAATKSPRRSPRPIPTSRAAAGSASRPAPT